MSKKILITGATSDIGKATTQELLSQGHEVILLGRDKNKLQSVIDELNVSTQYGYLFDNKNIADVKALFSQIQKDHGKLDALICCSGDHHIKPLKALKIEDLESLYFDNTISSIMFAKHFSANTYSNANSAIVFISSIAAIMGEKALTSYSASKGALISATRTLAIELATKNIRVNCISPGWVDTVKSEDRKIMLGEQKTLEMQQLYPLGLGTPQDVADLCDFLISRKSKWITGQNIIIDGGRSLL